MGTTAHKNDRWRLAIAIALGACGSELNDGGVDATDQTSSSTGTAGAGSATGATGSGGTSSASQSASDVAATSSEATSAGMGGNSSGNMSAGGAGGADPSSTSSTSSASSTSASSSSGGGNMVCPPNSNASCYTGDPQTKNVGLCKEGTKICNADGTAYGPCNGEVLPVAEKCNTPGDDNCNGQANEGCANSVCNLYSENFDDGNASDATVGAFTVKWCDTYVPLANNTPLCLFGRTLRTNSSTEDPTMWIHQGDAGCTQAKVTFSYYQFASSGVTVQYHQADDAAQQCEKAGTFTTVLTPQLTANCAQETVTIPFGTSESVYLRFEHGAGSTAIWLDAFTVKLEGCSC